MTKQEITIEIDDDKLRSYPDTFLVTAWHIAQANPAPFGDYHAGELVERLAREIVRRWLRSSDPELWHHQGRDNAQKQLGQFAIYNPPEDWQSLPAGSAEAAHRFHEGHWSIRPEAAAALMPYGADVVKAAIAWADTRKPGTNYARADRAEKDLTQALEALQAAQAASEPATTGDAAVGNPAAQQSGGTNR